MGEACYCYRKRYIIRNNRVGYIMRHTAWLLRGQIWKERVMGEGCVIVIMR